LKEHYAHLADKPFFPMIQRFMQSTPIIAVAVQGLDAASVVRAMTGITKASEAAPGTIRGDLAMSIQSNILHASDSSDSARKELARFFSKSELFDWKKIDESIVYSEEDLSK
jgi:nucleoside-diphosphate kinase